MTKSILIAGAHGGIGHALAENLAEKKHHLYLTARDKDTIAGFDNAEKASLDVLDNESIEKALESFDLSDGLNGFAYCVGSIDLKPFKSTNTGDFTVCMDLNFNGAVRMLQKLQPALQKGNGSVVLFSTVAVQQGFPNHSLISSCKGAIEGLTRTLAAEWAPDIRVNAIAPSLTETPLAEKILSSEQMRKGIETMHPLGRIGTANDIASMAAHLIEGESSWITGQVIHIDGGRSTLRTKG